MLAGEELDPLDALAEILAEEADADGYPIDGLWWEEAYDPERLSAPRGGIGAWATDRWWAISH